MKKYFTYLLFICVIKSFSQSTSENFVKTISPKVPLTIAEMENYSGGSTLPPILTLNQPVNSGTFLASEEVFMTNGFYATGDVFVGISDDVGENAFLEQVSYFDGLGRPTQTIAIAQSPNGNDFVQFVEYDQFGRSAKNYLPYASAQSSGNYISNPKSQQTSYYQTNYGDTFAYSETAFDDSPLNRAVEVSSPGADWQIILTSDNDHTIKRAYETNTTPQEIIRFTLDDSGSSPIITKGVYATNQLSKNITKNENWQSSDGLLNTIETYTDKNGRLIAKVAYEEVAGTPEKRVTQNIYDLQGRLRYIMPPKALIGVNTINNNGPFPINEELIYQYQYDDYNRKIAHKVPGSDWKYLIYDQMDRPILVQDANLAANDEWLFTKYDVFGRPVYSGIYSSSNNREQLQTTVDDFISGNTNNISNVEKRIAATIPVGGASINYSSNAFPKNNIEILSLNYYDDYNFEDVDKPVTPSSILDQVVTIKTKGFRTASFSKTLGSTTWTKLFTYYDEKGRPIKICNVNFLGGHTISETKFDFSGKTKFSITKHKRTVSDIELVINDRFTYDKTERPVGHYQKINNQPEERIAENEFDELGMLIAKRIGGNSTSITSLQELSYSYNIKGQLKSLNDVTSLGGKLFAYKLIYNEDLEGFHSTTKRYDGSIAQNIWRSSYDNKKKSYDYKYDKLNRLSSTNYQYGNNLNGNYFASYNTSMAYDSQGNISALSRKNSSGTTIDQLSYDYGTANGNQLMSVSDSGTTAGFVDGNSNGNDYDYDANGNLTKDLNKGISSISYNHRNLVNTISLSGGKSLSFTYSSGGSKLQKKYVNGNTTITEDYLGGFQYTQGNLRFFPTPEGFVYKAGNIYKYMYIYADHLGNSRVSYSDININGTIETNELTSNKDYFPFGGTHNEQYTDGLAAVYNYTFQGKEIQKENGVNWHDFGSRMYDASLGRWMATDPQNQFGSPYQALGNNPISNIDPDGEFAMVAVAVGAAIGAIYGAVKAGKNGGTLNDYVGGIISGGIVGAIGGAASQIVPGSQGFLGGAAAGAINGFAGGFASGSLGSIVNGDRFSAAFDNGLTVGKKGALTGALLGGVNGGIQAVGRGRNFVTGGVTNGPENARSYIKANGIFKERRWASAYGGEVESTKFEVIAQGDSTVEDPLVSWEDFKDPGSTFTKTIYIPGYTPEEIRVLRLLELAVGFQNTGEFASWIGYGLTLFPPTAEIGIPLSTAGGILEGVGTGGELLLNQDWTGMSEEAIFIAKKEIVKKVFIKSLPKPLRLLYGKEIIEQTIDKTFDQWRKINDIYYKY